MTPAAAIAALDRAVEISGEDIILRRTTGTQLIPLDVICRACVRDTMTRETADGITQDATKVYLSPSEMTARQWTWPPVPGDFAIVAARTRRIEAVNPIRMGGELVRLELDLVG